MVRQGQQSGLVDKDTRWLGLDSQDPEGGKRQHARVRCPLTSTGCHGLWPPNPNSTVKKKTIRFLNDKKIGNALSIAAMISRVYSCISTFVRWPPGCMWRQGHCMTQYWPVQHVLCVCVTKGEVGSKENWVPKFSFIVSHNRKGRREGCDWNEGGVGWSWSISLVTSQAVGWGQCWSISLVTSQGVGWGGPEASLWLPAKPRGQRTPLMALSKNTPNHQRCHAHSLNSADPGSGHWDDTQVTSRLMQGCEELESENFLTWTSHFSCAVWHFSCRTKYWHVHFRQVKAPTMRV